MMKNLQTYEEFLNEGRVYGLFNDNNGKPTKLDKEILDIALKALPKNVIDNIEDVEGSGSWKTTGISPSTVSNKGQSRGVVEYTMIGISLKSPMGRQKVTHITVGLRKRTSGPGTGYFYMEVSGGWDKSMPDSACAIEFGGWGDPADTLKKLFEEKIKIYIQ
jgi:hypothetical protein